MDLDHGDLVRVVPAVLVRAAEVLVERCRFGHHIPPGSAVVVPLAVPEGAVDEADLVVVERTPSSSPVTHPRRGSGPGPRRAGAQFRPGAARPRWPVAVGLLMVLGVVVVGVSAGPGRGKVIPIVGGRGEIGRAHRRHLWGVEVEGRSLCVLEAPLPPVYAYCDKRDDKHDERDAQA